MKKILSKNALLKQKTLPDFTKIKPQHMYQAIKLLVEENKALIKSLDERAFIVEQFRTEN